MYKRVKYACYTTNIAMAVVANLSPLLFITFRQLYGISYSLLGLLVLIGFSTQLCIDMVFSFFSHKFNIPLTVKLTPVLTVVGLIIYATFPWIFPNHAYLGLVIGTLIFAASGGLAEVLMSPVIAAIPAENPEREMSKLHSIYAWGCVIVIVIGTLFLLAFGQDKWQWLALALIAIPLLSCMLFSNAKIPPMQTPERASGVLKLMRRRELWLCVLAIFLGGASECTMAQWSSGYIEQALGIPKVWGDIFGMALFAVALGLGRSLYAKIGKNIGKVLFFGAIGASLCYLVAALSPFAVIGLLACALTGFCVSMMWPGSLIVGQERIPDGGVFIFAMMAAGGDLGASVGPQLVGIVTDAVSATSFAQSLATSLSLTAEQIGMKAGMLVGALFPIIGIIVYLTVWKGKKQIQMVINIISNKKAKVKTK